MNESNKLITKNTKTGVSALYYYVGTPEEETKKEAERKAFLEYAATKIAPNSHEFSKIEDYLIEKYNVEPYTMTERQLKVLKSNVIVNRFPEVLHLPEPPGENATQEERLEYFQNDTSFEQAREYPAEKLGLLFKAYKIPNDSENETIVKMEMTTQYMCMDHPSDEFLNDINLWLGVTQEDIDNKTPGFIIYAQTLCDLGRL